MLLKNHELDHYLLNARGISRIALNVMFVTCLFIFPWLIVVAFAYLGKARLGWAYCIPYYLLGYMGFAEPAFIVFAYVVHIAGWVHANRILTDYQGAARLRIIELDQKTDVEVNHLLEKGVLLYKVFREKDYASEVLNHAVQNKGGDPYLLNQAGIVMAVNKRYTESAEFYNRAYANTKDFNLIKQIKKNLRPVEKKLKRLHHQLNNYALVQTTSPA